jgi:hypothetical protein
MESSRKSFIDILKHEFTHPEVKKICIESSVQKIKSGYVTRAFDDFPYLLDVDILSSITDDFKSLFKEITRIDTSNEIHLANPHDKRAFEAWEKNIITHACVELVDKNGKVNSELVTLLSWEDYINKIYVINLISAYVGAINHAAMSNLSKTIENELTKFTAVTQFINANNHAWIIEVTKLLDLPIVIKHENKLQPEDQDGLTDRQIALGVGLGAGLFIAGAATLGILLFSSKSGSAAAAGVENLLQPRFS